MNTKITGQCTGVCASRQSAHSGPETSAQWYPHHPARCGCDDRGNPKPLRSAITRAICYAAGMPSGTAWRWGPQLGVTRCPWPWHRNREIPLGWSQYIHPNRPAPHV